MTKNLKCNTDLCVDVKTLLRSDRRTRLGRNYAGVLIRDAEEHYTFVEGRALGVSVNLFISIGGLVEEK